MNNHDIKIMNDFACLTTGNIICAQKTHTSFMYHLTQGNIGEKSTVKVLHSILSKALDDNVAEEGI